MNKFLSEGYCYSHPLQLILKVHANVQSSLKRAICITVFKQKRFYNRETKSVAFFGNTVNFFTIPFPFYETQIIHSFLN